MEKRKQIDEFLACRTLAVSGISRNSNKFGNAVYRDLKGRGMKIFPVSPHLTEVDGSPCFPSLSSLPEKADGVIVTVSPARCLQVVQEAHQAGIRNVWLQQGAQSDEALAYGREKGMNVVSGACIFMYAEPVTSIHKFHRGLARIFGKYQKPLA